MSLTEIVWNGLPISEPGLYRGVDMPTYHGQLTVTPSISSSGKRKIWFESAAHYYDESYLNPNRPPEKERPHFSVGRASHHLLLLGRKGFDEEFCVRPEQWSDWRSKDSQAWKAEMLEAGKTILTLNELENITGMAASLGRDPLVRAGILDGLVERTIVYFDPEARCFVKSRPDSIPDDNTFSDLKTTTAVDDDSIQRAITDFGYNQQGATVRSAAKWALNVHMKDFALVFVEKVRPFCTRTVTLKPEDLDRGEHQNRVALWKFAHGLKTGEWPGPGSESDAQYMGLMPYATKRIDDRLAIEIPEIEAAIYAQGAPE